MKSNDPALLDRNSTAHSISTSSFRSLPSSLKFRPFSKKKSNRPVIAAAVVSESPPPPPPPPSLPSISPPLPSVLSPPLRDQFARLTSLDAELRQRNQQVQVFFCVFLLGAAFSLLISLEWFWPLVLLVATISRMMMDRQYQTNVNHHVSLILVAQQELIALALQEPPRGGECVVKVEDATTTDDNNNDDDQSNNVGYQLNSFANLPMLDFERDVLSQLIPAHQELFARFDKVAPPQADKFTRLRFLQADRYDVNKALTRLTHTIEWRALHVDPFLKKIDRRLIRRAQALRPRVFCGFDKNGLPLYVEKLGEFFGSDEASKGLSLNQWVTAYAFGICEIHHVLREGVERHHLAYNHRISFIGDMTGLRWLQTIRIIPLFKALVKEVETHFPEMAGPVVLVNVPSFVEKVWVVVKKFMDPNTVEKITFCSGRGDQVLLEAFGAQVLPVCYGGLNPINVPGAAKNIYGPEFSREFGLE